MPAALHKVDLSSLLFFVGVLMAVTRAERMQISLTHLLILKPWGMLLPMPILLSLLFNAQITCMVKTILTAIIPSFVQIIYKSPVSPSQNAGGWLIKMYKNIYKIVWFIFNASILKLPGFHLGLRWCPGALRPLHATGDRWQCDHAGGLVRQVTEMLRNWQS